MSTYAEVRQAIRDVVAGLAGFTHSPRRPVERIPATNNEAWFVITYLGTDIDEAPTGDDVAIVNQSYLIEWWSRRTPSNWETQHDADLDRIEAVRNALDTAAALGPSTYATYLGDTIDEDSNPQRGYVALTFNVQHLTTY